MNDSVKRITAEITAVIERHLRLELLRGREAMLESELAAVRAELGQLGTRQPIHRPAERPVSGVRQLPEPPSSTRPVRGKSARALIIRTLKYARHPMTIKELTKAILRKGWKTTRKYPTKTVDAALRKNPQEFRRTAPSTFELNR
jgi:hypothetical protein